MCRGLLDPSKEGSFRGRWWCHVRGEKWQHSRDPGGIGHLPRAGRAEAAVLFHLIGLVGLQCTQGERSREIVEVVNVHREWCLPGVGDMLVGAMLIKIGRSVTHARSTSSPARASRNFWMPSRIRVLIVPSGSPSASATSRWVRPRK